MFKLKVFSQGAENLLCLDDLDCLSWGSGLDLGNGWSPLVLAIFDCQTVELTIQNKKGLTEIPEEVNNKQEEKEKGTKGNTAQVE